MEPREGEALHMERVALRSNRGGVMDKNWKASIIGVLILACMLVPFIG
jgi:hypothetical protein